MKSWVVYGTANDDDSIIRLSKREVKGGVVCRSREGREACQSSPLVAVVVPRGLRRSSASSMSAPTTHGQQVSVVLRGQIVQ